MWSDKSLLFLSSILQDCANPDVFYPERYLEDESLPDPKAIIFGFGRRCVDFLFVLSHPRVALMNSVTNRDPRLALSSEFVLGASWQTPVSI